MKNSDTTQILNDQSLEIIDNIQFIEQLPQRDRNEGSYIDTNAGQILFYAGDAAEYVYFLLSGTIQGLQYFQDGCLLSYFNYTAPVIGALGGMEALLDKPYYIATLTSLTDCRLWRISTDSFRRISNSQGGVFWRSMCYMLSEQIFDLSRRMNLYYGKHSSDMKVMSYLLDQSFKKPSGNESVIIDESYATIGANLCLSSRTITRAIGKLKKMNLVRLDRKKIIVDRKQIEEMASLLSELQG